MKAEGLVGSKKAEELGSRDAEESSDIYTPQPLSPSAPLPSF
jgi:hypothetical protein